MSKKGTSTFIIQRATAVVLIPLAVWLLFDLVNALNADFETARAWLARPLNTVFVGAFVIIGALHMRIGMAEIIIDYIQSWLRDVLLFLNWLAAFSVILVTVWALYAISFVG